MKVSFKNVGIVESAEIDLRGLTIITGLNDTGKSVISKSIFSIIKTLYRANEIAIEDRNFNLTLIIQQIVQVYRQSARVPPPNANEINQYLAIWVDRIQTYAKSNSEINIEQGKILAASFRDELLTNLSNNPLSLVHAENGKKQLISLFDSFGKLMRLESLNEEKFKTFFNEVVIRSIFQGQFNYRGDDPAGAEIIVEEGDVELLKFKSEKDKTVYFNVLSEIIYNDATLIESPYIVQLSDFINVALAYLPVQIKNVKQSNLPYHVRDISLKIRTAVGAIPEKLLNIFNKIRQEIGGFVHWDAQENTIVFEKDSGQKIKSYNIASGIKSFGLIQMYLASGLGNSSSLLIIDEPEVHLHLKWQLIYAKILVELSMEGIPILLSTHSPFFLEALSIFVKQNNASELVTIYNGVVQPNGRSKFLEIPKDDLSAIFEHLSEPIARLQIIQMND
jgi:hypothetical protein